MVGENEDYIKALSILKANLTTTDAQFVRDAIARRTTEAKQTAFDKGRDLGYRTGYTDGYDIGVMDRKRAS